MVKFLNSFGTEAPYLEDLLYNTSKTCLKKDLKELIKYRTDNTNSYTSRIKATLLISKLAGLCSSRSDTKPTSEVISLLRKNRITEALQLSCKGKELPLLAIQESTYRLTYEMLEDEVTKAVRENVGNQWIFRVADVDETSLNIVSYLKKKKNGRYPCLIENTPVRLDFTHSAWSDIFFVATDFPEGAKVINMAVNLCQSGSNKRPTTPIKALFRVIDEPVIKLRSLDLVKECKIKCIEDVFNLKNGELSLLKAAVIASGIVPPYLNNKGQSLERLLGHLVGSGKGFELISEVENIPPQSRFAVSTNLLASLITLLMRASNQITSLEGTLPSETQTQLVMSRVTLAEWLGGSSGGWQDTGGIIGGIKGFYGQTAECDSAKRGKLLPKYNRIDLSKEAEEKITSSMVLVHGGLSINVTKTLQEVTEKYLLKNKDAAHARQLIIKKFDDFYKYISCGDIKNLSKLTTDIFYNELRLIIPDVTNLYTETIIENLKNKLGDDYYGFMMLGGLSGGGMVFWISPNRSDRNDIVKRAMRMAQQKCNKKFNFITTPIVYNFEINNEGTSSKLNI